MASSTLYPPIVESTMPSFVHDEDCAIYFRFSDYNTTNDIDGILCTLCYQKNNLSALITDPNDSKYYELAQFYVEKSRIFLYENDTYYFKINDGTWNNTNKSKYNVDTKNSLTLDMKTETPEGDNTKFCFYMDSYYKMQLRFVAAGFGANQIINNRPTQEWWVNNKDNISEWSEVTLLKPLHAPYLNIKLNKCPCTTATNNWIIMRSLPIYKKSSSTSKTTEIIIDKSPELHFVGSLGHAGKGGIQQAFGEDIDYYQILIVDADSGEELYLSENIIDNFNNNNEINKKIVKIFVDDGGELNCSIYIKIATLGGYVTPYFLIYKIDYVLNKPTSEIGLNSYDNAFIFFELPTTIKPFIWGDGPGAEGLNPIEEQEFWSENNESWKDRGRPSWGYYYNEDEDKFKGYVFRKNINDQSYQLLYEFTKDSPAFYRDFTVEAGEFYKYYITNGQDNYTVIDYIEKDESYIPSRKIDLNKESDNIAFNNILADYEDMFLYGGEEWQLKIQYNPKATSIKYKVSDSSYDTLGSQYPILVRNGNLYYKTYQIGGLISMQEDPDNYFMKEKEKITKMHTDKYELYEKDLRYRASTNSKRKMAFRTKNYELYEEKRFRDEVIKFLMNGKPKLLKSPTEGNAIVKLTDVNFTPNQTLGRMIWEFSATVTEFAECTLENLRKYNLINTCKDPATNDVKFSFYDIDYYDYDYYSKLEV